jgi:hypothetical protein
MASDWRLEVKKLMLDSFSENLLLLQFFAMMPHGCRDIECQNSVILIGRGNSFGCGNSAGTTRCSRYGSVSPYKMASLL